METTHYAILDSIEVIQVEHNKFALQWKEKVFYVGEVLFRIVQLLKQGKELSDIQHILSIRYQTNISTERLEDIIQENIFKKLVDSEAIQKESYIKGRIKLLHEEPLFSATGHLTFLFQKKMMVFMALLSVGISIWFAKLLFDEKLFSHHISMKDGLFLVLINYLFFFLVGMVHEFGHAAAARKYNISSKEIGFGFYFVLPVLYTDVSKIWVLSKYKRLLVNIGGIYFQFLINILLLGVFAIFHFYFTAYQWIPASLFTTNVLMALYSLNPFFRNDGYWMYSDFFEITNLSDQAQAFPVMLYQMVSQGKKVKSLRQTIGLAFYSAVKYCLIILLPVWLFMSFRETSILIVEFVSRGGHIGTESMLESIGHVIRVTLFFALAAMVNFRTAKAFFLKIQTTLRRNEAVAEVAA